MRQQLDIADVEGRTKIRAKYLRALENEEWSLLPGPTFVKTFLRTYAEVVGVDPHILVEEYRVNHEPGEDYDFQPLAPVPRDSRRGGRGGGRGGGRRQSAPRPFNRGAIVAMLAIGVVAFLLVLGLLGGDDGDDPGDAGSPVATTDQPAQSTDKDPARRAPAATPRPGVRLRIAPMEPTYVCVDTGPETPVLFEGTLDAPRTFRSKKLVRVNLGRRSIELSVNGHALPVEESAEPLGLAVRPGGTREIPEAERPCV